MYLRLITGPMRSGKTSRLIRLVRETTSRYCVLVDFHNERNSKRDLKNALIKDSESFTWGKQIIYPKSFENFEAESLRLETGIVIIDEVHLFCIKFGTERVLNAITALRDTYKTVIICGLFNDCYNAFKPFDIWQHLIPLCDDFQFLKTRYVACAECGAQDYISYSIPDIESEEYKKGIRAGNHYKEVCFRCKDKYGAFK